MSLFLSCQSLSKSFGNRPLFSNISISLSEREKLGLIGPNGSGKSTLLKIIAGLEEPDSGEVAKIKGLKLVYLSQEDNLHEKETIEEYLLKQASLSTQDSQEIYLRVRRWLDRAGFENPDQIIETLSGGWRKRLSIIESMIHEPDILLMDEPTNHLDLEGILWLEALLENTSMAFILVSHDRYFLENVTQNIVEINFRYPEGYLKVNGSYSDYILQREAMISSQEQLESILANKSRRETQWLHKGPKARTTKASFRIEEAYRLQNELKNIRERNHSEKLVNLDFSSSGRKTKILLSAKNLSFSINDKKLFSKVSIELTPGKCIGLIGRNGAGKSTLLSILAGKLSPEQGEIKRGENIQIVTFDQKREELNPEETLQKSLVPFGDSVVYRDHSVHVVTWAKKFLFKTEQLVMPVKMLSGGEKSKIIMANLMLQKADILLLDEPTNDLDIPSLEILEESLKTFPGAILLVTHDRFLLDRLADQIIVLDGQGGSALFSDLDQWLSSTKTMKIDQKSTQKISKPKQAKGGKLSYKFQRELENIEERISKAEKDLEECQKRTESLEVIKDPELLKESCLLLEKSHNLVNELYNRWAELDALK